jgi:hypothetical protein
MSGAQIARNAGSTRPVEAIAIDQAADQISQVDEDQARLSRARPSRRDARTMASGLAGDASS